jgi:predicted nucleic acid-binding protein
MKPRAYVETTVVSYLTARPSRDVVIAAQQQITREWWQSAASRFDLIASELVVQEASAGDPDAAKDRIAVLEDLELLEVTSEIGELAQLLMDSGAIPRKAPEDALHIALAAINGIDYLVTWNCRHIANAALRTLIDEVCLTAGYSPVVICTPQELMETSDEQPE